MITALFGFRVAHEILLTSAKRVSVLGNVLRTGAGSAGCSGAVEDVDRRVRAGSTGVTVSGAAGGLGTVDDVDEHMVADANMKVLVESDIVEADVTIGANELPVIESLHD